MVVASQTGSVMGLIYDGVIYNGEQDILECRLYELADVVHKFIIIEGDKTFTGKPKERAPRDRFAQWADQIIWVDYETPTAPNAWTVETATRDHIFTVAKSLDITADDVITVCDTDEIWSPWMARKFQEGVYSVYMRHLAMSVHWELPLELTCIGGPMRLMGDSADRMRRARDSYPHLYGGWHVSWMGGPEWCANKIRQFSHQELNQGDVDAKMRRCFTEGLFVHDERYNEVDITDDWPRWIKEGKHPQSWVWKRSA